MSGEPDQSNSLIPGTRTIPLPVALIALIASVVVFYVYAWPWLYWSTTYLHPEELPGLRSHWHAPFSIQVCGMEHPPLPYSNGDIHTHGQGQIHIHPESPSTAGKNANLSAFFESIGGTITQNKLSLPPLLSKENGDRCEEGGKGKLNVYVNGSKVDNVTEFVPRNGDKVIIYFGPPLPPMESPDFPERRATETPSNSNGSTASER